MTPADLRVNGMTDPIGIDGSSPRFSWKIRQGRTAAKQWSYRLKVTTDDEEAGRVVWESGEIQSRQTHCVYEGQELIPQRSYTWELDVRDGPADPPTTVRAKFETGLGSQWPAQWISSARSEPLEASHFERHLEIDGEIKRGRAYATALGIYRLSINRAVVSTPLAPGWTDYRKRVCYQVYDITRHLVNGDNLVQLTVAPGWYAGHIAWFGPQVYGKAAQATVVVDIRLKDGSRVQLSTDDMWTEYEGTIVSSDLLMGECQRLDRESRPIGRARIAPDPDIAIESQQGPPIQIIEELTPKLVEDLPSGGLLVDIGHIISGWLRLTVSGREPVTIAVEHGEALHADRSLYVENLRTALQLDRYELPGGSELTLEPWFTIHGFRYARVAGPKTGDHPRIKGVSIHTELEKTGDFACSDEQLNRLHENIVRSHLTNSVGIPTDCPQRDERLGWLGDEEAFTRTAAFNRDVNSFLRNWLTAVADGQRADGSVPDVAPFHPARFTAVDDDGDSLGYATSGWADAIVSVPWDLYLMYGDQRVLQDMWDPIQGWIQYLVQNSDDLIYTTPRYGDWLSDGRATPMDLIGTAYFARSARTAAKIARKLDLMESASRLNSLYSAVREQFVKHFVGRTGRVASDTQTSYVLALNSGLAPEHLRNAMTSRLVGLLRDVGWRRNTGFLGTPHLLPTLASQGATSAAYQVLNRKEPPSWRSSIEYGATTMWERFDGWTPENGFFESTMNSFNHYTWGSVGQFLYEYVVGLHPDPASPGFSSALIAPHPGPGIDWVSAWHESPTGRFEVAWTTGDIFSAEIEIPTNADAVVSLPWTAHFRRSAGGRRSETCEKTTRIGSGHWRIEAAPPGRAFQE